MISISKDQIDTLIQLQEIELEVDTIEKKLNKIPARLDDLDAKLTDFTKGIEEKERMLAELEKTYQRNLLQLIYPYFVYRHFHLDH